MPRLVRCLQGMPFENNVELWLDAEVVSGEFFTAVSAGRNHVGDVSTVFVDYDAFDVGVFPFVSESPHGKEQIE